MLRIMIAGNDKRSIKAAQILKEHPFNLEILYLQCKEQLKEKADVYLLPVPFYADGKTLNNSLFSCSAEEFLNTIPKEALILSVGFDSEGVINMAERDDFAYRNAVPTAEGAIALAINATKATLCDSNILITGFGRVAKLLAHRLSPFSENITVAVRKSSDRALIESLGLKALSIDTLAEKLGRFDIVFNTVPFNIFNSKTLSAAKNGSVFIELASGQSGFDTAFLQSLPIIYINAPGLPGKVAPDTAGRIMAETVINILKENLL